MTEYESGFMDGLKAAVNIAKDKANDECDPHGGDQKKYEGANDVGEEIILRIKQVEKIVGSETSGRYKASKLSMLFGMGEKP